MQMKRAGLLTKIVVLALLIYMATALLNLRGQLQNYQDEEAALSAQVEQMQQENDKLSYALENKDDPAVQEQAAQDEGYVGADERVFIDITN